MTSGRLTTVLFDLDGTLADTAGDLCFALNSSLSEHGFEPVCSTRATPLISHGAPGMITHALGSPEHPAFNRVLDSMLEVYGDNLATRTTLFDGMEEALARLEQRGIRWGVVTNKRTRFTTALLCQLGLFERAGCIICGDTTANKKPHPEPVIEACRQLRRSPAECAFVGDSIKDIQAGNRAGTTTLIARYGYIAEHESPDRWNATGSIESPSDLPGWIEARH